MKKNPSGQLVFSPSDLVRFLASPFASWMDRLHLENPSAVAPDAITEDERLIAQTGEEHEQAVLADFRSSDTALVEIPMHDPLVTREATLSAIKAHAPVIYQAALADETFAGFADFLLLDESGRYQVWDTKLARSPKPHFAIQLCCYSEMLAAMTGDPMPDTFGLILGTKDRVAFRVEDFLHYYRHVKAGFLNMQKSFTGNLTERPIPLPRADHGRWSSHAEQVFQDTDHLVQVAGISSGQMKKLMNAGITTMSDLALAEGQSVPKLTQDSLEKLAAQARLQCRTRADRTTNPDAPPHFDVLPVTGTNNKPKGLLALPPDDPADVFFDIEGYPLVAGGLEYLFGVCTRLHQDADFDFKDWWAHTREEERLAFEGFIDWVYERWQTNPCLHIYHYAPYEVGAVRRLSTRHDTRQDEVDALLRNDVFVDLCQIVRQGLRIGEPSYSLKAVERLYRPKRSTEVGTAMDSIVQYARWIESRQPGEWRYSPILNSIRDYNKDDCRSTAELLEWLRKIVIHHPITAPLPDSPSTPSTPKELSPEIETRLDTATKLRAGDDPVSMVLADLIDFHRREEKPMWWRMFDRAKATTEELYDDPACLAGLSAVGSPEVDKQSLIQAYRFDASQECKLAAGHRSRVMFTHNLNAKFTLWELDLSEGILKLKIGKKTLQEKCEGLFPQQGALLPDEYVSATIIQTALTEVARLHLSDTLPQPVTALLRRVPPMTPLQYPNEAPTEAAIRIAGSMSGGCLIIQGPPGTGKTYTASQVIASLLAAEKTVGITSNSHHVVMNLLSACGEAAESLGRPLQGIKVGGDADAPLFTTHPGLQHLPDTGQAHSAYTRGVIGGTAWLFTRPEWEEALDFLFIDEAGQVALANAIAMARCAKNLILLGDQMQLEQPVQGSHPGDAGLSALQYALKDTEASHPDAPVFHAVVPSQNGLFLGQSRRMHPAVCRFISESMYEGRLASHPDCARQTIGLATDTIRFITRENGIVLSGVEHDGNIQQSEEEVGRVTAIFQELCGQPYTDKEGITKPLALENFLFIAPYNAQVRALQAALPPEARVGSVDRFQGQEAPVCILSLCSSYGEYGSRGLGFILDRNRLNVALSRAQCLAVVVADPRIAASPAGSLEDMQRLNLFCKLLN